MADACNVWKPLSCLQKVFDGTIAVIKLNTAFHDMSDVALFARLWRHAVLRACTDGAANVLHDCKELNHSSYLPNFVSGDFDSVRPDVLEYYSAKGCEIISTPDQDETDFTKCLRIVINKLTADSHKRVDCIVVHVNTEGRLDHILANINTLFTAATLTTIPVYLITGESLSCLLPPGCNVIDVSDDIVRGKWCSLVPVGRPCSHVTTTGLVYNLVDNTLEFGHLVSTSNAFSGSPTVTITTDERLLWSMGINFHSY